MSLDTCLFCRSPLHWEGTCKICPFLTSLVLGSQHTFTFCLVPFIPVSFFLKGGFVSRTKQREQMWDSLSKMSVCWVLREARWSRRGVWPVWSRLFLPVWNKSRCDLSEPRNSLLLRNQTAETPNQPVNPPLSQNKNPTFHSYELPGLWL